MDKEKVLSLANLARIEIGDNEAENLTHEFDVILGYVGEVKKLEKKNKEAEMINREESSMENIMREDAEPHESGLYTKRILEQAPAREGDYIKVKRIL